MKRSFLFICMISLFMLSAQTIPTYKKDLSILECGNSLYIFSAKQADIFLDAVKIGSTPMLLQNISEGSHTLLFTNGELVSKKNISVQKNLKKTITYEAELLPKTGSLEISSNDEQALIYINGSLAGKGTLIVKDIKINLYEISIKKQGMVTFFTNVNILEDKTEIIKTNLTNGFKLEIGKLLNPESKICIQNYPGIKTAVFKPDEEIYLPKGSYTIVIKTPEKEDLTLTVNIEKNGKNMLFPESSKNIESVIKNASYSTLYIGFNETILNPNEETNIKIGLQNFKFYIPNLGYFNCISEITENQKINFNFSSYNTKTNLNDTGNIIFWTGLSVASVGFLCNLDFFAVLLSSDYEMYKYVKYISLGAIGSGIALSGTGYLLFTFN